MNHTLARILSGMIPARKLRHRAREFLLRPRVAKIRGVENVLDRYSLLISYSQFAEDIVLYKYLHAVRNGYYIDVGAADPEVLSVTKFFYDRGWSGLNVEPRDDVIKLYEERRPRDTNVEIAVSDRKGRCSFFVGGEDSTMNAEDARRQGITREISVEMDTLAGVLQRYSIPADVHFLKIDVENHEREVLLGMDFAAVRPWLVAIESTIPGTLLPNHKGWEPILLRNGYSLLASHVINRYYVANERKAELESAALDFSRIRYLTNEQYLALGRNPPAVG